MENLVSVSAPALLVQRTRRVVAVAYSTTNSVATVPMPVQITSASVMSTLMAFDASRVSSRNVLVAFDADVDAYDTPYGERRVIAIGTEGWALGRRVGTRLYLSI